MSKIITFSGEIVVDPSRAKECLAAFDRWFDEYCKPQSYSHIGCPTDESADERVKAAR